MGRSGFSTRAICKVCNRPNLDIEQRPAANAWIGIEDEFVLAEASEIDGRIRRAIERDLPDGALEGMEEERRSKVRKRAAWFAQEFVKKRRREKTLHCDACEFDPSTVSGIDGINPHSPLDEGVRDTTIKDFALLCPTYHRVEHARIKVAAKG